MKRLGLRILRPALLPAIACGVGLVLAGCSGNERYFPQRTGYIDQPQRNQVSLQTYSQRLRLDPMQTRLTREQVDALNTFLATNGQADGDHLEIRTAMATRNQRNAAVAADLRQSFLAGGYAPSKVELVDVPQDAAEIEVVINRYSVVLPDCTNDVRKPSGIQNMGSEPIGLRVFGCSTERDLGLMIADPRDLAGGQHTGPSPGYREADAVLRYRKGEVKELAKPSTSKEK
ncbi:MAG: hypothetical protein GC201_07835 [Alphaproteobacteria bacterium]|nr:hypothetical protein [Alphaproteobacteria bacterium]